LQTRFSLIAGAALTLLGSAVAITIHVPADVATIQGAISAASNGDVVAVHPGTYLEHEIDFLGKAIRVTGIDPLDPQTVGATVINGQAAGTVFYFHRGETRQSVLTGLTIMGGLGEGYPNNRAGGVTCRDNSSPTIEHCLIRNNTAGGGGGIYVKESAPSVSECTIRDNQVEFRGGGIYCHLAPMEIARCTIVDNVAAFGGGITCNDCTPQIHECDIRRNYGSTGGGGIVCAAAEPSILNCMIIGNDGGGAGGGFSFAQSSPVISNCTIANNIVSSSGGGAFFSESSPTFVNCIFWGDATGEFDIYSGTPAANYCDIQGGFAGQGNLQNDPRFVNPADGDFHIQPSSPCVDRGTLTTAPEIDFDGDPRPSGDGIDIGADELFTGACDLQLALSDYPASIAQGNRLTFKATVGNSCDSPRDFNSAALDVAGPAHLQKSLYDGAPILFQPETQSTYSVGLDVPPTAPLGDYRVTVGIYRDGELIADDSFDIQVVE
jgi:hypothetical protein